MKKTLTVLMMVLLTAMLFVSCDNNANEPEKKPETKTYKVGDTGPAGGIIFYDAGSTQTSTYKDKDGKDVTYTWRYLEAAPQDYDNATSWGPSGSIYETKTDIGEGKSNTAKLMAAKANDNTLDFTAAEKCVDYGNGTDYDDWFLPSKDELNEMYKNKDKIGSFDNFGYWSSSEYNGSNAWEQLFNNGYQDYYLRGEDFYVRPIRAF